MNTQRARAIATLHVLVRGLAVACLLAALMAGGLARHAQAAQYASIVVDAKTGRVLSSANPDVRTYPASLTKMMTLYMLFDALEHRKVTLKTPMRASQRAVGMAPSKLGLRVGQTITVEDAIKALVTKSANDVAVVVAEHLGGTEVAFASKMTQQARQLGMDRTTFRNASGLPNAGQVTTARDIATLSLALQNDFPRYYPYFSIQSFSWAGQTIRSHNRVLLHYAGADGLKTGYIRASGFNLATSAQRNGVRLVGVVMGGRTSSSRDQHMMALLDKGFAQRGRYAAATTDAEKPQPVRKPVAFTTTDVVTPAIKPELAPAPLPVPKAVVAKAPAAPATTTASNKDRQPEPRAVWGVQVGAFSSQTVAEAQARKAADALPTSAGSPLAVVVPANGGSGLIYRARLLGMETQEEAREVCGHLRTIDRLCMVVPPGSVNMAYITAN